MSRPADRTRAMVWRWLAAASVALGSPCAAQEAAPDEVPAVEALEQYLADRGLRELLATHLEERLRAAEGQERLELADRLGRLYVELMDASPTPEARRLWEERSNELLRLVPEADSFDLRINLAKARYLHAESIAERHRLRLSSPEENAEAERILREVGVHLQDLGGKIIRRVEVLERREQSGRVDDMEALRAMLADARRQRSLAMYYAGWSNYYIAFLTGAPNPAAEALTQWGWLLNASGGRQATVDRLPETLLRYDHIARAAIGCALAETVRGNHDTAVRWLDAVERAANLPAAVRGQLFARRLVVLAAAKRWADLEVAIRRRRQPDASGPATPLPAGEARLLAVLMLEALKDPRSTPYARETIHTLAAIGLGDLVNLGEVKHVLDLVSKYGTTPLAGEGFIVQYVRGLQAYEQAREAHADAGGDPERPARADAVANRYRDAAGSLRIAVESADAQRFPEERANAGLLLGLSLYYAGDLEGAADRLEAVHAAAATPAQAEEALWLAIVALDNAVEQGRRSLVERRDRLATLYLGAHPQSERAAKLLLRQSTDGLVSHEEAVRILLGVSRDSALYEAARRQAATLLYGLYRRARGPDRDFAAIRFASVAEEVLAFDRRAAAGADDAKAKQAAGMIVLRVRQILDAVLGMTTPDLDRARKALDVLDAVSAYAGLDLSEAEGELAFRRFQIAQALGDESQTTRWLDRLHEIGGPFADSADRLLYRRALQAWNTEPRDARAARLVVRHGARVMSQFGTDAAALADPSVHTLHDTVARAAAAVWRAEGDEAMRDVALRIDAALIADGHTTLPVLRRYAELSEAAGEADAALDAWRRLLAGLEPSDPEWYEARYHSLRLLAASEPARARQALDQHRIFHPDLGPEPWGERLRQLDATLPPAPAPAPPAPGPEGGP